MKCTIIVAVSFALAAGSALSQTQTPAAPAAKPRMAQVCGTCHSVKADELRGVFENVAFKSKSIQLKIDNATEIVRFDEDALKVLDGGETKAGETLRDVVKGREARIVFVDKDGSKTATLISFKGPIKIAPERLVNYADVARLVSQGPDKGNYTLIDSRPLPRYQEGAIPTAINLPYPAFDKFVDRLPADKAKLVVFYCSGVTCTMSPKSMQRAESMGYTNAKVYREGMPEWTQKNYGVLSTTFLKEAWTDKDIPHVLIDVRPAAELAGGYIPGAISLPSNAIKGALTQLPDRKLKAPTMVYDAGGGDAAVEAAKTIVAAGYSNVNVVTGGFNAWKAAGYAVASGSPSTKIAYAPKPRPGEISIADFTKLARATPPGVLILDVRNVDEAAGGVIKGSLLVPDEDIVTRMGEIPKDRKILTHCLTGVRAEMAYHKLKEKGYDVAFLNANIEVAGDGTFKVTPR
ncbi:MAG: rhodanese-like domain-containing protein [Casimicrobiaceae bacterium]